MRFLSRKAAGRELAAALRPFAKSGPVLYALPRGGIVVGAEVARLLRLPLDLILVRKITHPSNPEYAVGAVAEGAKPVYEATELPLPNDGWRADAEKSSRRIIARRRRTYFNDDFTHPSVSGKPAIVIDDGMATGLTMRAAVTALRAQHPQYITVAVPAATQSSIDLLKDYADECIVLDDPDEFQGALGLHYDDFPQIDDNIVKRLLHSSAVSSEKRAAKLNRARSTVK